MEEQISIGVRLTDDGSLEFFGLEEVNARLSSGGRVVRVEPGQILLEELEGDEEEGGEDDEGAYALAGCEINVTLSTGGGSNGRRGG